MKKKLKKNSRKKSICNLSFLEAHAIAVGTLNNHTKFQGSSFNTFSQIMSVGRKSANFWQSFGPKFTQCLS